MGELGAVRLRIPSGTVIRRNIDDLKPYHGNTKGRPTLEDGKAA